MADDGTFDAGSSPEHPAMATPTTSVPTNATAARVVLRCGRSCPATLCTVQSPWFRRGAHFAMETRTQAHL